MFFSYSILYFLIFQLHSFISSAQRQQFPVCNTLNCSPSKECTIKNINVELQSFMNDLSNFITERKEKIFSINEYSSQDSPKNCADIQGNGYTRSGVYTLLPDTCSPEVNVYCDLTTDGGRWLVIQRRMDGSEDFFRGWSDYKNGFGNPSREFWLGNDLINLITNQYQHELRIDLEDYEGNKVYAHYSRFSIEPEPFKYKISIGDYSGTAGDSFSGQNKFAFTTKDQDNDIWGENCAVSFKGAWWYNQCHASNLNGLYVPGGNHTSYADGINWNTFKGLHYSLKRSEMKIRPILL